MLQVDVCPFASDALEDAMRLAQTKALNSYTFSDCLSFLNYIWSDIYSQICMIDSGYYSKTVRLTNRLTKLPKFVKNSIMVYAAQSPLDANRQIYRSSGPSDVRASYTYNISGTDLFCPDAERSKIWLEYCPQPSQIFFTHHNRDPKLFDDEKEVIQSDLYNLYKLVGYVDGNPVDITRCAECTKWELKHRNELNTDVIDITDNIIREEDDNGKWTLKYISCDYPYIFCSYQHNITGEWKSGFFTKAMEWTDYNPFSFLGRNDNVEYVQTNWNDKTGLGVIVRDWNDIVSRLLNIDQLPKEVNTVIKVLHAFEYKAEDEVTYNFTPGYWYNRFATDFNYEKVQVVTEYPEDTDVGLVVLINDKLMRYNGTDWEEVTNVIEVAQEETHPRYKELGWTPDTKLVYPAPEVYRYLVARLAEKFATLNESSIMAVQSELVDSKFAFQAFLKKDKSAWQRMRNVNLPTMTDWL